MKRLTKRLTKTLKATRAATLTKTLTKRLTARVRLRMAKTMTMAQPLKPLKVTATKQKATKRGKQLQGLILTMMLLTVR